MLLGDYLVPGVPPQPSDPPANDILFQLEALRPLAGLPLTSVVIRTAKRVAAADRKIHPSEEKAIILVPSFLRTLLDVVSDLSTRLPKLTLWSASGEVLPPDLVRKFRESVPTATLLNIYGSTEVTANVTCHEVERTDDRASVPIGRPISNTQIFVLDRHKNLVPPLVHGEIHVGGDCLARGYWKQPELTSQQFIPNLHHPDRSRSLFATGDLGRIRANGTFEYLGRLDQQIKLRGIRIELGEIEANLAAHPLVRDAVIAAHGKSPGTRHLIAYIVRKEGSEFFDRPAPQLSEGKSARIYDSCDLRRTRPFAVVAQRKD